jgi:hypothetical protein
MPDNHLNFVYQLDGDVKEIDVFQLAPTLLALGQLIQDSNRQLNPDGPEIGVNVKPFREGSFIVDLTLFAQSNFHQMLEFFTPHSIEQLKSLLEIIGLTVGGTGTVAVGAVKTIRFLKGRPKSVEEISPGEFRFTAPDDRTITVDRSTHTLLTSPVITNNIMQIYVSPLESQPSVVDVKTYLKDDEKTAVKVGRDEIPMLRDFAESPLLPAIAQETEKEIIHAGIMLNPKRGAFGDDPKDWSFWRGDNVITATIKDKDFLQRCASGEIRPNQNDLLTVELLERQKLKGTALQKPTYEILRVTNYVKGPTQQALIPRVEEP